MDITYTHTHIHIYILVYIHIYNIHHEVLYFISKTDTVHMYVYIDSYDMQPWKQVLSKSAILFYFDTHIIIITACTHSLCTVSVQFLK